MDSQLLSWLHQLSARVGLDLPTIAIVGAPGAGKTSLIEAISGISPGTGTYTQCPIEYRLSHTPSHWRCDVSLHITTDSDGRPVDQPYDISFGPPIYDKESAGDRVRRAQAAILNPFIPAVSFLNQDLLDVSEIPSPGGNLKFSMNCISLAISGSCVPALSFVDLPGLTPEGDIADRAFIQGLVMSYIKKSNCVILLTVACGTSFENQGASMLARICDPEGERTVGVLTKPDRMPSDEASLWFSFIRNEKVTLANNWFCVKQTSVNGLAVDWTEEEEREDEVKFFADTPPWNELDEKYLRFLRTENLVERLGSILGNITRKSFAEIQEAIAVKVTKTKEQINTPPSSPLMTATSEVAKLVRDFDHSMRIEGIPGHVTQHIRVLCEDFGTAVRNTAPEFSSSVGLQEGGDLSGGKSSNTHEKYFYVDMPQEFRSRERLDYYPLVTQLEYFKDVAVEWGGAAAKLCEEVYLILLAQTNKFVHQHFASYGHGVLERQINLITQEHLGQCFLKAKGKIEWLTKINRKPSLLEDHYPALAGFKEIFLNYYQHVLSDSQTNGDNVSENSEESNQVLEIMATTRAYFQVAYRRFLDIIPMAIDYELLRRGEHDIFMLLMDKVVFSAPGPDQQKVGKEYVGEAGHIADSQDELQSKLEILSQALFQLNLAKKSLI